MGYITQAAVLPAFAHAGRNSELAALVSDDPKKLKELSRKYRVERTYRYDQYDECLREGKIDAVYIALPNQLHREYAVRAAEAGVHGSGNPGSSTRCSRCRSKTRRIIGCSEKPAAGRSGTSGSTA